MRGGSRYDMDFGGPLYPFSNFVRAVGKANAKGGIDSRMGSGCGI